MKNVKTKTQVMTNAKAQKYMTNGNIKVGKMWTFNKLAGNSVFMGCKGTCSKYCKGCWNTEDPLKSNCYVAHSYGVYKKTTIPSYVRNTVMMREHMDELFEAIQGQILRARYKRPIRIHASGEFENTSEILWWFKIAQDNPDVPVYVYTKAYDLINRVLRVHKIPANMWINISIWHENGIKCYNKWKHLNNIRAFVYDDGYDYKKHGLDVNIHCPAYNNKGKMNHDQTCADCKWCFENKYKVVGCFDH